MNLVSPSQGLKPTVSTTRFNFNEMALGGRRPVDNLNVFILFCLLEKLRNEKLRELYHGSRLATRTKRDRLHQDDADVPRYPPRYQCLDLSTQGLVFEMSKLKRDLSKNSLTKEQWKALDRATKAFLEDMVNILNRENNDGSSQIECRYLTPTYSPSRTITPPPSPLTLQSTASEDSILPQKKFSAARRREVNLSNDEIITMWNRVAPTVDGVDFDFDVCLGIAKNESGDS